MKFGFLYRPAVAHQGRAMRPLVDYLNSIGHTAVLKDIGQGGCGGVDITFIWNIKNAFQVQSECWINLECGYINGTDEDYTDRRHRFISYSINGMHYTSKPIPPAPSSDRWDALGIKLQPWKAEGRKLLFLMQHPGDAQCPRGYIKIMDDKIREAKEAGWHVKVRPHPMVLPVDEPLEEQLAWADACITWCSNASVEALIAGVPTIMLSPQGIAYDLCSHSLEEPLRREDRLPWCHDLAYRQFNHEELRNGIAWKWIWNAVQASHGSDR